MVVGHIVQKEYELLDIEQSHACSTTKPGSVLRSTNRVELLLLLFQHLTSSSSSQEEIIIINKEKKKEMGSMHSLKLTLL